MNTEELAFVNRQLAGMLKSGIPLEAGLKKITESMSDAKLKGQLAELGERLEKGQAMEQAVEGLDLPETYKRLLALGQAGQGMPRVLTCVADYYERIGSLTTRLRGLAITRCSFWSAGGCGWLDGLSHVHIEGRSKRYNRRASGGK